MEQPTPMPVTLSIYDVGTSGEVKMMNRVLRPLGAGGAFHCGVEVYGMEWSYGDYSQGTGVFSCRPRRCEGHTYSESVSMGTTALWESEFTRRVKMMESKWMGSSYDLLHKNCCHFCEEILDLLGVDSVPTWVMKLASTGAAFQAAGAKLEQQRRSLGTLLTDHIADSLCCGCEVNGAGKHAVEIISAVSVKRANLEAAELDEDEDESKHLPWPDAFAEARYANMQNKVQR